MEQAEIGKVASTNDCYHRGVHYGSVVMTYGEIGGDGVEFEFAAGIVYSYP